MWTRFDACVSAIAAEVGLDPDRVTQDNTNIKRWINDTRQEIFNLPIRFSALEFVGEFIGAANVTAGTVNATNGQAEITGSGTSWTSQMAGRYFLIATGQWQRVSYVTDTTHLSLEAGYNQGTTTGATYKLWKRYYSLPHKVGMIDTIFDMSNARFPLAYYDHSEFYLKYGYGDNSFATPMAFTQWSSTDLGDAYNNSAVYTGISITANSPVVDFGAGSGLSTGLAGGDRLIVGNSTTSTAYVVERVLTDTKCALTEFVGTTTTSLSATAFAMNRINIQLYPALDNTTIYYYEAYKRPYDLIGNAELIEEGWYPAVKKGAITKAMGYVHDPREPSKLKEYGMEVANLIRTQFKAKNPSSRLKPHIPRRYGTGGFYGYFPSKYDLPY